MREKRTYIGEMEWALQQIHSEDHDRNPNRYARCHAAAMYGLAVAIARRSKEPIPPRPDLKHVC